MFAATTGETFGGGCKFARCDSVDEFGSIVYAPELSELRYLSLIDYIIKKENT